MKDYLNQEERKKNTLICIMYGVMQELLERNNGSKEEMKNLKLAYTYIRKYVHELMERVNYSEGQRIKREATYNYVQLKPKVHEDEGQQVVDKECMEGIAEKCIRAYCFGCERHDWQNCELYEYMHKLDIETIYGIDNKCMYWYPKGGFKEELTEEDLK